jgi:uncharacterized membrane protein
METIETNHPPVATPERRSRAPEKRGGNGYPGHSRALPRRLAKRDQQLARGLGWFSIALGVTELLAPRKICQMAGVRERTANVRACGMREIASGFAILSRPHEPAWLWLRVAGDALDLGMLGRASARHPDDGRARTLAMLAVAGVTAVDVYAARRISQQPRAMGQPRSDGSIRVERNLAINRPPDECYAMWRDLERLPRFMKHLESVKVTGANRSHWVAKGPAGTRVEWDAEITAERPGEMLAWRSIDGADVANAGAVRFLPDRTGRGTFVNVSLAYKPPAGGLGVAVAKLFGEEPDIQIGEDLRRFKWLIETGELPTTEGQPRGQRPLWHRMVGGAKR